MNADVIAKPGDQVTCPNGHVLYRVRNTLIRHTSITPADFKSAHPEMPEPNGQMKPCAECGAHWWRDGEDGVRFQLHFSDGWRPHGKQQAG